MSIQMARTVSAVLSIGDALFPSNQTDSEKKANIRMTRGIVLSVLICIPKTPAHQQRFQSPNNSLTPAHPHLLPATKAQIPSRSQTQSSEHRLLQAKPARPCRRFVHKVHSGTPARHKPPKTRETKHEAKHKKSAQEPRIEAANNPRRTQPPSIPPR